MFSSPILESAATVDYAQGLVQHGFWSPGNPNRKSLCHVVRNSPRFLENRRGGRRGDGTRGGVGIAGPDPGRAAAARGSGRRACAQPRDASAHLFDHRRFDLPGEPGTFWHAPVRRGLAGAGGLQEALAKNPAGDPRRVRPQVRPVVPLPRGQGEVQRGAVSGLRRLARPRPARLAAPGAGRQSRPGPHLDGARLGHPPRDGLPHLGDRHEDGVAWST